MVAATFCKVDAVKFQKRTPRELLSVTEYDMPHPNPMHAYGETYGKHREFLEFDADQHRRLKATCEQLGVAYSTSVWDLTSAKEIVPLAPQFLKIPSACNLRFDLLEFLCEAYAGQIHISLGMTTVSEEERIVSFFEKHGRNKDVVLYSCTSGYPVAFKDICLREISRLAENYSSRVGNIGFSGHHLGFAADIAAMTLGASWIERHFTLDRTWKGTDHAASLEPDGMRRLVRDVRNVAEALQYKPNEMLEVEHIQRAKLKRAPMADQRAGSA
jgi:sialic acid synthase